MALRGFLRMYYSMIYSYALDISMTADDQTYELNVVEYYLYLRVNFLNILT